VVCGGGTRPWKEAGGGGNIENMTRLRVAVVLLSKIFRCYCVNLF
jgi:hypothetical protein